MSEPIKLVHVTTVPVTMRAFLLDQMRFVQERGMVVCGISSPGEALQVVAREAGVRVYAVEMRRQITPWRDLVALARTWRLLRRIRPRIVHAHTPKGGLIGTLAAWLAGVPVRIYHIRGLPLVTASGWRRRLLRGTERISCRAAHQVLCVSHSLREVAIAEGLCPPQKIKVLLGGSGNGVDAAGRFHPERVGVRARPDTRRRWGIPEQALVVGYVGRLVRDKGLGELVAAWQVLREELPELHLLVVGPFEPQDPVPAEVAAVLRDDPRIHLTGEDFDMPPLYAAMDLVCLPTHREGFPNVPLEAAAMGLAVVATRVPGCVDAVQEGVTGLLVPAQDSKALAEALRRELRDGELRRRHGEAGRQRVLRDFDQRAIWEATYQEYQRLLGEHLGEGRACGRLAKRLLDVTGAVVLLGALGPLLVAAMGLVAASMGRPVLFRQARAGQGGRTFTLYKLRTMTEARDGNGRLLPDGERLSGLGRWLRASSLDELPQLWNVLRGEMSLVGPRPLLPEYLGRYRPEQARRHLVKPGITGWAQVHGRNALDWEERFRLDVWYVDHRSCWLDLRILAATLVKVLRREGISQAGEATMPPFLGSSGGAEPQ